MDKMNIFRTIKIGNCSTGNSEGGVVLDIKGLFSTITAGVYGYSCSNVLIIEEDNNE